MGLWVAELLVLLLVPKFLFWHTLAQKLRLRNNLAAKPEVNCLKR